LPDVKEIPSLHDSVAKDLLPSARAASKPPDKFEPEDEANLISLKDVPQILNSQILPEKLQEPNQDIPQASQYNLLSQKAANPFTSTGRVHQRLL
jgi:hypothetical protein